MHFLQPRPIRTTATLNKTALISGLFFLVLLAGFANNATAQTQTEKTTAPVAPSATEQTPPQVPPAAKEQPTKPADAPVEPAMQLIPAPPEPAGSKPADETAPAETAPEAPIATIAPPPFETKVAPAPQAEDLWARIRRGFRMNDLATPLADNRTQWYANQPDYFNRMTARASRYLYHIVEELERRNMPTELALLPFVESAFNPQAFSSAKAAGMWQFIPSTGKHYKLKQTLFHDERRHVTASTGAALNYLQRLFDQFGDWHLALAAYNWGEGSVARAQKKNEAQGLSTAYTELGMPTETQYYVPKLQAIKNIIGNPAQYSINLPDVPNHPYFDSVQIARDIDVALVAKLADISVADFHLLNPSFKKPTILGATKPTVLLPYDNAALFKHNMEQHRGALASWSAVVLSKSEKPAVVAKRFGISEANLRSINNIPPRMIIRAGSTLVVPRGTHREADVSARVAENAVLSITPEPPPLRRASHKVRKGESLASIAQRYRVSAAQLRTWNKGIGTVRTGQSLVVYVPNRGKAARGKSRGRTVAAAKTKHRSRAAVRTARSRARA